MDEPSNTTTFVVVNKGQAKIKSDQSIAYLWINSHDDLGKLIQLANSEKVDSWRCAKGVLVRLSEAARYANLVCTVKKVQDRIQSCCILGCA